MIIINEMKILAEEKLRIEQSIMMFIRRSVEQFIFFIMRTQTNFQQIQFDEKQNRIQSIASNECYVFFLKNGLFI